jgi:hypothetical protein
LDRPWNEREKVLYALVVHHMDGREWAIRRLLTLLEPETEEGPRRENLLAMLKYCQESDFEPRLLQVLTRSPKP